MGPQGPVPPCHPLPLPGPFRRQPAHLPSAPVLRRHGARDHLLPRRRRAQDEGGARCAVRSAAPCTARSSTSHGCPSSDGSASRVRKRSERERRGRNAQLLALQAPLLGRLRRRRSPLRNGLPQRRALRHLAHYRRPAGPSHPEETRPAAPDLPPRTHAKTSVDRPRPRTLRRVELRKEYRLNNLNRVILTGYLGKDPEVQPAGATTVTKFSVAVTDRWKDGSGEKQERTN